MCLDYLRDDLYRIPREALGSGLRHSQVSALELELRFEE